MKISPSMPRGLMPCRCKLQTERRSTTMDATEGRGRLAIARPREGVRCGYPHQRKADTGQLRESLEGATWPGVVDHARGQGLCCYPPQCGRSALAKDASEVPPRAMSACSDISHSSTFAELLRLLPVRYCRAMLLLVGFWRRHFPSKLYRGLVAVDVCFTPVCWPCMRAAKHLLCPYPASCRP